MYVDSYIHPFQHFRQLLHTSLSPIHLLYFIALAFCLYYQYFLNLPLIIEGKDLEIKYSFFISRQFYAHFPQSLRGSSVDKAQLRPMMLISSTIFWIAFPFFYVSFFLAPTPTCLVTLPKVNSLSANLFSTFWESQDKLTSKQVIAA